MDSKAKLIFATLISTLLSSCAYNPFIANNRTTGNPAAAVVGAGIGAGGVALLGGSKPTMAVAGIAGAVIGYYVSTLRYDSGGVIQAGGTVYRIGDQVGIYIPTDNLFEPNTDRFLPQAAPILESVAAIIERYPNHNILISGNTSGFYRPRWEQNISERRAQKISAYLWNEEINNVYRPGRKLNYVGYGDYFPISSDLTNKGIRENSRVQITLYTSDCDILLNKRQSTAHNIGALDLDQRIVKAPACQGPDCRPGEG